jgi:hypothetical protein
MSRLVLIGLIFLLSGCLLVEDKKVFQGDLQKFNGKEKNGLDLFDSAPARLIYVTNNQIKRLEIVQDKQQLIINLNRGIGKESVHGSFTLETLETRWDLRAEGQIDRRFLSDPMILKREIACTFSGICEKEIEKEVKECRFIDGVEKCEITTEIVEESGWHTDCPGTEILTLAEQKTIYDLHIKFFNPLNNQLVANFQGSTDELIEETSRVQTKPCN